MGDLQVYTEKGQIAFCSGLHGWAINSASVCYFLHKSIRYGTEKLQSRLWGDNFLDDETKKFTKSNVSTSGALVERTFCKFVLLPIYKIFDAVKEFSKRTHTERVS